MRTKRRNYNQTGGSKSFELSGFSNFIKPQGAQT